MKVKSLIEDLAFGIKKDQVYDAILDTFEDGVLITTYVCDEVFMADTEYEIVEE